jgi:hypothetical protein
MNQVPVEDEGRDPVGDLLGRLGCDLVDRLPDALQLRPGGGGHRRQILVDRAGRARLHGLSILNMATMAGRDPR